MKELVEKVAELYAAFEKDAKAQVENGNKIFGSCKISIADKTNERRWMGSFGQYPPSFILLIGSRFLKCLKHTVPLFAECLHGGEK